MKKLIFLSAIQDELNYLKSNIKKQKVNIEEIEIELTLDHLTRNDNYIDLVVINKNGTGGYIYTTPDINGNSTGKGKWFVRTYSKGTDVKLKAQRQLAGLSFVCWEIYPPQDNIFLNAPECEIEGLEHQTKVYPIYE